MAVAPLLITPTIEFGMASVAQRRCHDHDGSRNRGTIWLLDFGRFSVVYKALFDESPSASLRGSAVLDRFPR
jgi:hypothetical protein